MNPTEASPLPPVIEPDPQATYALDIVAQLTGVSSLWILRCQEQGLIRLAREAGGSPAFDDEDVRALRRIEHLRTCYGVNDSALKLLLTLMDEVEALRAELRHRQRHL